MTLKRDSYNHLFTLSGCLTPKALENYNSQQLSPGENALLKDHVNSCELCFDAINGLEHLKNSSDFAPIVNELNNNLLKNFSYKESIQNPKTIFLSKKFLAVASAASIIIFFGLFSYIRFYLPDQNSEISELNEQVKQEKNNRNINPEITEIQKVGKQEAEPSRTSEKKAIEPESLVQPVEIEFSDQIIAEDEIVFNPVEEIMVDEDIESDTEFEESVSYRDRPVDIASVNQPIEYFIAGITISTGNNHPGLGNESSYSQDFSGKKSSNEQKNGRKKSAKGKSTPVNSNENMAYSKSENKDQVLTVVEQLPSFPGGEQELYRYLYNNISYPEEAKKNGLQGTVLITFIVEESGEITNIKTESNVGGGCEDEAIRVIEKMPDWYPGTNRNKPVRVQYTMPIKFSLGE